MVENEQRVRQAARKSQKINEMIKELNIGIVGLGTVGSGVIKSLEKNRDYFKNNYDVEFNMQYIR